MSADGDVADGDVADGDVADGDVADGDVADGDVADGDVAVLRLYIVFFTVGFRFKKQLWEITQILIKLFPGYTN